MEEVVIEASLSLYMSLDAADGPRAHSEFRATDLAGHASLSRTA